MPEIISVVIALFLLMIANIIMGKKLSDFKNEFDKEKFIGGISKAMFLLVGLACIYIATLIYPMNVAEINGEQVTTLSGTTILLKTAIVLYGAKCLVKLKDLFLVDLPISSLEENNENEKEE